MIKLSFCLRRKPGMTTEEFQRYWRDEHAPLVRKHQGVLGMRRYVQVHTDLGDITAYLSKGRGAPEPFDGIAELWYDSREALASVSDNPDARAAGRELFEDEKRFIDLANSPILIGDEHEIIADAG